MEDEVSFTNKYPLIATINHSGTFNRGHYWAFIKELHLSTWYSCNDKLLMLKKIMSTMLRHTSFFTAKFKFFPRIFQIFF